MNAPTRKTLLDCLLHWERATPDAIYLTQPMSATKRSILMAFCRVLPVKSE